MRWYQLWCCLECTTDIMRVKCRNGRSYRWRDCCELSLTSYFLICHIIGDHDKNRGAENTRRPANATLSGSDMLEQYLNASGELKGYAYWCWFHVCRVVSQTNKRLCFLFYLRCQVWCEKTVRYSAWQNRHKKSDKIAGVGKLGWVKECGWLLVSDMTWLDCCWW